MIWNDTALHAGCVAGMVEPFDPALVNPASIDLRLGCEYRRWVGSGWGDEQTLMRGEGLLMQPGEFVLCCSLEVVSLPLDACATLFSKSSTGRRGIEHLHAGWVDPGFSGQLTWELKNVSPAPAVLITGKPLMQLVVMGLVAPAAVSYAVRGRYQGQRGATPARG